MNKVGAFIFGAIVSGAIVFGIEEYRMKKVKKELVLKLGKMVQFIKVVIKMEKKMVLDNIFGVIILNMKVNGKIIFYVVMVFIILMMEEFILDNGIKI